MLELITQAAPVQHSVLEQPWVYLQKRCVCSDARSIRSADDLLLYSLDAAAAAARAFYPRSKSYEDICGVVDVLSARILGRHSIHNYPELMLRFFQVLLTYMDVEGDDWKAFFTESAEPFMALFK
jgi:hypothetical protein